MFDDLRYPSLAPPKRELVEDDGLISGRGCIPGETESKKVELQVDNLISGRGVIP